MQSVSAAAQLPNLEISDLSPRLRELVQAIGLPAAVKLIMKRGGTRIYVPTTPSADHTLEQIIGTEATGALIAWYGAGTRMDLDSGVKALRNAENRAIVADSAELSVQQLALKYGRTERGIFKVLKRQGRIPDKQLTLYT